MLEMSHINHIHHNYKGVQMFEFYKDFLEIYSKSKDIKVVELSNALKIFLGFIVFQLDRSEFLFKIIFENDLENVKNLHEIGLDIKSCSIIGRDNSKISPLQVSVFHPEMFELMLSIYDGQDKEAHLFAFQKALEYGDTEIIGIYAKAGHNLDERLKDKKVNALEIAINSSNMKIIEALLENGASPSKVNEHSSVIPLIRALSVDKTNKIAKKLIEFGASVDEKHNGMSNLIISLTSKDFKAGQFLIDNGANVNEILSHKDWQVKSITTLGMAAMMKSPEIVSFLLKNGANASSISEFKQLGKLNAYDIAAHFKDSRVTKILLEHHNFEQQYNHLEEGSELEALNLIGTTIDLDTKMLDPHSFE